MFFETSAKSGLNVTESIQEMARLVCRLVSDIYLHVVHSECLGYSYDALELLWCNALSNLFSISFCLSVTLHLSLSVCFSVPLSLSFTLCLCVCLSLFVMIDGWLLLILSASLFWYVTSLRGSLYLPWRKTSQDPLSPPRKFSYKINMLLLTRPVSDRKIATVCLKKRWTSFQVAERPRRQGNQKSPGPDDVYAWETTINGWQASAKML